MKWGNVILAFGTIQSKSLRALHIFVICYICIRRRTNSRNTFLQCSQSMHSVCSETWTHYICILLNSYKFIRIPFSNESKLQRWRNRNPKAIESFYQTQRSDTTKFIAICVFRFVAFIRVQWLKSSWMDSHSFLFLSLHSAFSRLCMIHIHIEALIVCVCLCMHKARTPHGINIFHQRNIYRIGHVPLFCACIKLESMVFITF